MTDLQIYKNLIIPEIFGNNPEYDIDNVEIVAQDANKLCSCDFAYGASKLCLIPTDSDKVVKIPFYGNVYIDEDDDNNDVEYLERFEGAYINEDERTWDYCLSELTAYESAATAGFSEFLAKTEFLGYTVSGHPLYTQEVVKPFSSGWSESGYSLISDKSKKKSREIIYSYRQRRSEFYNNNISEDIDAIIGYVFSEPGEEFLSIVIEYYGIEKVSAFSSWVMNNARHIAYDLHWNNIGFRESDNSPCLLDFSGFFD